MMKRLGIILAVTLMIAAFAESGHRLQMAGFQSIVSTAEARVGRPLTPVSVAGVGRRTVRRCAAGVYYC